MLSFFLIFYFQFIIPGKQSNKENIGKFFGYKKYIDEVRCDDKQPKTISERLKGICKEM